MVFMVWGISVQQFFILAPPIAVLLVGKQQLEVT